jgi:hypothetical protein
MYMHVGAVEAWIVDIGLVLCFVAELLYLRVGREVRLFRAVRSLAGSFV